MVNLGVRQILLLAATSLVLAACGPETVQVSATPGIGQSNSAPAIRGTPAVVAEASSIYSFTPSATDADGDSLSFSILNKPAWASFNVATGELSGTAQPGSYANIVIQVADGVSSSALPAFTLEVPDSSGVSASGTGTAHLSWNAPELNTDGSSVAKSDLAGYRVYHGTSRQNLNDIREVPGSGQTEFTLDHLLPGTHFFAVTVVTANGIESSLSEIGSKTIM